MPRGPGSSSIPEEHPVTQSQLESTVARRTGESLATIRHLGFHAQAGPPADLEPEDLHLAVDCPFCGGGTPLSSGSDGLPVLAECDRCDVFFDYAPAEVYAAGPAMPTPSIRLRDGVAA